MASWDPEAPDTEKPSVTCLNRIKKDIEYLYKDEAIYHGICIQPSENNFSNLTAIIIGPEDTPYDGGFFQFFIAFPPNYPFIPPRVKLLTTSNGRIRFNPNLYANGKVCLSILGTWEGPVWTASQNLGTVLVSIQSLMNEKPYCNEPAYNNCRDMEVINNYNSIIIYYTLRYAVCEVMENIKTLPEHLSNFVIENFKKNTQKYLTLIEKNRHLDGKEFVDNLGGSGRSKYDYKNVQDRLLILIEEYF